MTKAKKPHIHKYMNTGGGTLLIGNSRFPSDDDYVCRCGRGFKIESTTNRHFQMPNFYKHRPKDNKYMRVGKSKEKFYED